MDAGQDGTARAAGRVQLLGWKRDEHGKQQKADICICGNLRRVADVT